MPRYCAEPTCATIVHRSEAGHLLRFCSRTCKDKSHFRDLKRGAHLWRAAKAWRTVKRSHAKGAHMPPGGFGRFTALLDEFLREDRAMREAAIYFKDAPTNVLIAPYGTVTPQPQSYASVAEDGSISIVIYEPSIHEVTIPTIVIP